MGYLVTGGLDSGIARSAWEIYSPSFNLTVESVVFAAVTGILIWLIFLLVWYFVARFIKIITAR
jgi:hypothetical protein